MSAMSMVGGGDYKETYSARNQLENGVASDIDLDELVTNAGVSINELEMTKAPSLDEMAMLDPIYVSYFVQWNSYANYIFSKSRGFHDLTHEWDRTHTIENFDQVESRACLVHAWLKYPKFGHASATDYASRFVRYGMISRDEAIQLVKEHDSKLDPKCVSDFIEFLGYSESEFWEIVDKLYNRDLFYKNDFGEFVLKDPVWNHK